MTPREARDTFNRSAVYPQVHWEQRGRCNDSGQWGMLATKFEIATLEIAIAGVEMVSLVDGYRKLSGAEKQLTEHDGA